MERWRRQNGPFPAATDRIRVRMEGVFPGDKSMRRIALPNILERSSWVVRCRSFTFLPDPKAAAAHYGARLPKRRLPPAGRGPPDDGHAQRFRPPQAG